MIRDINDAGLKILQHYEGFRNKAYPDPASPLAKEMRKPVEQRQHDWEALSGKPWTIGYGSTYCSIDTADTCYSGPITPDMYWTEEEATAQMKKDLVAVCREVQNLLTMKISSNQFSALVCFAYNVGTTNLSNSTLLKYVNQNRFDEAAEEFLKWNKAKGVVLNGLTNRRDAERRLFLTK